MTSNLAGVYAQHAEHLQAAQAAADQATWSEDACWSAAAKVQVHADQYGHHHGVAVNALERLDMALAESAMREAILHRDASHVANAQAQGFGNTARQAWAVQQYHAAAASRLRKQAALLEQHQPQDVSHVSITNSDSIRVPELHTSSSPPQRTSSCPPFLPHGDSMPVHSPASMATPTHSPASATHATAPTPNVTRATIVGQPQTETSNKSIVTLQRELDELLATKKVLG